ncbi:beta-N-acetylhexosaminidase family protein [Reichenbachiella versicolor]|uniref:hypothetical protein n=1 Tax=Reichenbachiella versicolor TaxID=1821036 RepID=UPI000D6E9418|nr:hypothetical protein [Reichenbachiella versicolor]
MKKLIYIIVTLLSLNSCSLKQNEIAIYTSISSPQTNYALSNISSLFDTNRIVVTNSVDKADIIIEIDKNNNLPNLKAEGFSIQESKNGKKVIIGKDPTGAMYGIFDIAEELSFGKSLDEIKSKFVNPSFKNRFIKFNLPWEPYRDRKVVSVHEQTCRDTLYWKSFLDMMAVNRLNVLSLWNLHPFTDMIKPDKYPDASSLTDEELSKRKEFWKTLFAMAKERAIQTYIVNWNIFLPEAFVKSRGLEDEYKMSGKHWGEGFTSPLVEDYTRESVKQVINEYPNLTGIGITLGEGMGGMTSEERRDWVNRTIIKGMNMADRKAKLLYRAPLSASTSSVGDTDKRTEVLTRELLDTLQTPLETVISFKYNWSHGHSSDKLVIVHGGVLTNTYWNPAPDNYSILWTVRNEDFFIHRWAEPEFVRRFAKNNLSQSYMSGCIIGSECYIPAKDYISNETGSKYFDYAYERQWLWYSIWGRMLYDIETNDELFAQQLNKKFDIDFGGKLLETWKVASSYYHHFSSFYRGSWDAALYSEAFSSIMRGPNVTVKNKVDIVTMAALGNRPVLDTTQYVNISDFIVNKDSIKDEIITPIELVDILNKNGDKLLSDLEIYRKYDVDPVLEVELTDIEILANLQLFFAERINATTLLGEHLLLGEYLQEAEIEKHLDSSIQYWQRITELKERYNKKQILYAFNDKLDHRVYLETLKKERKNYKEIKEFWIHNIR